MTGLNWGRCGRTVGGLGEPLLLALMLGLLGFVRFSPADSSCVQLKGSKPAEHSGS